MELPTSGRYPPDHYRDSFLDGDDETDDDGDDDGTDDGGTDDDGDDDDKVFDINDDFHQSIVPAFPYLLAMSADTVEIRFSFEIFSVFIVQKSRLPLLLMYFSNMANWISP